MAAILLREATAQPSGQHPNRNLTCFFSGVGRVPAIESQMAADFREAETSRHENVLTLTAKSESSHFEILGQIFEYAARVVESGSLWVALRPPLAPRFDGAML